MTIPKPATDLLKAIQNELNEKTKPLGSLGQVEELALQIALIQGTLKPKITRPTLIVFAADHGIARSGVSPYPQSVTAAMVQNFAAGGAAVNVFTRQLGWELELVNCGTVEGNESEGVLNLKIGPGTANFLETKAMSDVQLKRCLEEGAARVRFHHQKGSNTIGFGEMGIGNTSSAALLMHCLSEIPLARSINRGAGCDDAQLASKLKILQEALRVQGKPRDAKDTLQTFGGFEIAAMVGAMLEAARLQMLVLVDGFIATSAALVAINLDPDVKPYLIFAHQSEVSGHDELLRYLDAKPLLKLDMRLGEGTGVALSLPLLQCAVAMLCEMATFASASVSKRIDP